jgi:hypothetical protein
MAELANMKTKRRTRKFADGGYATAKGENENISEDIRARALRSVMPDDSPAGTTGYGEQNDLPETKTVTKTTVSKTPAKAPTMPAEEKERMETLVKKQALTKVNPEEAIIGGGAGKLLQMAGKKLASKIAAKREVNRKTSEGFSPAEALAAREKVKTDELIKKAQRQTRIPKNISKAEQEARKERYLSTGPMEDAFGTGSQFKRGFKSGGSVKTSASKRADGCAVRGKTRA